MGKRRKQIVTEGSLARIRSSPSAALGDLRRVLVDGVLPQEGAAWDCAGTIDTWYLTCMGASVRQRRLENAPSRLPPRLQRQRVILQMAAGYSLRWNNIRWMLPGAEQGSHQGGCGEQPGHRDTATQNTTDHRPQVTAPSRAASLLFDNGIKPEIFAKPCSC